MPLLKKRQFEKQPLPDSLKDDDEVFYCDITNEIFRDYEEFSERMFLYNSMVWTCSMTGKSNLTYQEAMESEENAKQSLKEFCLDLRIPILFLASKTQRSSFGDMAEDVFMYIKDRFFIGENLESSFTGSKWKDSHVLQVIAPSEEQLRNVPKGNVSERQYWPPANLFKYEIEHLDADDNDISEIMIVDHNQLKRRKANFSREKCKLFLKQYVEQDTNGVFVIKQSVQEDFGVAKMKFEQIFDGPLPAFETSKRIDRKLERMTNGKPPAKKRAKQETLAKFLSKNNNVKENGTVDLLEQMRRREEEFKIMKQQKEEEKLALKKKQIQEYKKIKSFINGWQKVKDDLVLENQKALPVPTPVKCKVPDKFVGDMFMVMEYIETFSKLLKAKDFFPSGINLELMERALTCKEIAGPFTDLVQMFLTALFNVQDEESGQYRTAVENTADIKEDTVAEILSLTEATRLATLASSWSNKYQGLPLGRLPLYSVTVSEILRLHLLSSGARINETGARWRYAQRGGYTSEDDPGLHLRLHQPHILKALAIHNVVQLPIVDKLRVLSCLMNQLMTYADVRDVIEERMDKVKQMKSDLKAVQLVEKKREQEYVTNKLKLQKEMKEDKAGLANALEKLEKDLEKRQIENTRKISKLYKEIYELQPYMGCDRAFRKYMRLDSLPAIVVCTEAKEFGDCLSEVTKQNPDLVDATRQQLLKHVRQTLFDRVTPSKINGVLDEAIVKENSPAELLMCTANRATCLVHSESQEECKWFFFKDLQDLEELEGALNKRGVRESEILQVIKNNKDRLSNVIQQTPVQILNPSVEVKEKDEEERPMKNLKKAKDRYEDANLGYPGDMSPEAVLENALLDNILEMEEKIYAGNLGSLMVKNRDEWRTCLSNKNYSEMNKMVTKKHLNKKRPEKGNHSRSNTPDITSKEDMKEYQDPGRFLGTNGLPHMSDTEEDESVPLAHSEKSQRSIKGLAFALTQVARAVDGKYLKKPLGHMDPSKNIKKLDSDMLDKWEQALLATTSYSQVFLHYGTLDSCVMWSRSALLARCRICRRQKDSENMLLCDNCNLGHHLYCLKPKLTSVPKGDWFCTRCKAEKEKEAKLLSPEPTPAKKRRIFRDEDVDEDDEEESSVSTDDEMGEEEEQELDEEMEVEEDVGEVKVELCKTCGSGGELITCEKCTTNYHLECYEPPLRRAPRGSWTCNSCKEKERYSDSGDEVHTRRSHRREDGRNDLPLHNVELQELLSDVMKQEEAWPFLRPVQSKEVPDYYDIIENPMDFGTIKYKLNMGEYSIDGQLMQDAVLVFQNCNTYNDSDAEVYRCGVKLLKYFTKRAKDLGLKLPQEMENEDQAKAKKRKHL